MSNNLRRRKYYEEDFGYLCATKRDFTIRKSRYSDIIKLNDSDNAKNITYSDTKTNFKIFHLVKKIKKEITENQLLKEISKEVRGSEFRYNSINSSFGDFCAPNAVNVDLNSAYLTVLNRDGIISDELSDKINDLPKDERLKCLGLLAYEPQCFEFKNGEPFGHYTQKNEFKDVFFYAVKKVSDVMDKSISVLGSNYIFFWVDGVYFFEEGDNKKQVKELFEAEGFRSSIENLTDFKLQNQNEKYISLKFKNENDKIKRFNVRTDYYQKKIDYGISIKNYLNNPSVENFEKIMRYKF